MKLYMFSTHTLCCNHKWNMKERGWEHLWVFSCGLQTQGLMWSGLREVAQTQKQTDGSCGNFTPETSPERIGIVGEKVGGKTEECQWHLKISLSTKEAFKLNSSHYLWWLQCCQKAAYLWEYIENFSHHLLHTEHLLSWDESSCCYGQESENITPPHTFF